jgi:hypothetical protein
VHMTWHGIEAFTRFIWIPHYATARPAMPIGAAWHHCPGPRWDAAHQQDSCVQTGPSPPPVQIRVRLVKSNQCPRGRRVTSAGHPVSMYERPHRKGACCRPH